LEAVGSDPMFILDGAHNPAAAKALATQIREYFADRRVILIFAIVGDKDIPAVFGELSSLASEVVLSPIDVERSMTLDDLDAAARPMFPKARRANTIAEAISIAHDLANKEDVILLAGSLFAVGEAKRAIG
ncbi:glutamate ligase domain-containing protein, partial [Candidatus Hydrogenedentota bacterium]